MKKFIVLSLLGMMAMTGVAQNSVADIAREHGDLTDQKETERHFERVWKRNSYFNLIYTTGETLSPKDDIITSADDPAGNPEYVQKMKSNWGAGFKFGGNIGLHQPIANILRFNIDVAGGVFYSHFAKENGGKYNSFKDGANAKFYIPWNLKKNKFQAGIEVGPSITVAPFTALNAEELHYLKLNLYYHLGFSGSVLLMSSNKGGDLGLNGTDDTTNREKLANKFDDSTKGSWGLGLSNTFGFSLSWKVIGLGYEYCRTDFNYKPLSTSNFNDNDNKFKVGTNRIFIQFRY